MEQPVGPPVEAPLEAPVVEAPVEQPVEAPQKAPEDTMYVYMLLGKDGHKYGPLDGAVLRAACERYAEKEGAGFPAHLSLRLAGSPPNSWLTLAQLFPDPNQAFLVPPATW